MREPKKLYRERVEKGDNAERCFAERTEGRLDQSNREAGGTKSMDAKGIEARKS